MINKSNSNQPENECIPCSAYEYFVNLSKTNDAKEAFLDAIDFVIEHLIDDLAGVIGDRAYSDGHQDGFADAYKDIAENPTHTAEILNEMNEDYPCDTCDCGTDGECKINTETVED